MRLNRLTQGLTASIYAKIESRNPVQSVKDRLGAAIIWDAEKRGELKSGVEIIEATSGNTGIALAALASARGYKATFVMPETMSLERRRLITAFGARLLLTPGAEGMNGARKQVQALVAENPGRYFEARQFENPANPAIHEQTTAREIFNDLDGNVDALVAGVGTGGTITGVARYFKRTLNKPLYTVAVEPAESPLITQSLRGEVLKPAGHKIQGIGANFIPKVLEIPLLDRVETVSGEEAYEYARRLSVEEGILSGLSSGAAAAAAVRVARQDILKGKSIVVVLPDSGERYLSTPLFA